MPKNINASLEKAILSLSIKEKDKMLLRLIAKNKLLVDQLQYTLLEDASDLKDRVETLKETIRTFPFGYKVLDQLKFLWSKIKHHQSVTKDSYSSVDMMLLLILTFLESYHLELRKNTFYTVKVTNWLSKRIEMSKNALAKLDSEYHLDFENTLEKIEELMPYY